MNSKTASAGNSGQGIRSDCTVRIDLLNEGGININLKSKVEVLYGKSIRELCIEELRFFGIENAKVNIDDSGALPFVISARIESAVRKLNSSRQEFLPGMKSENMYSTIRDRFRFSRLYIPGNTPSMMINAGLYSADGIILDLEDSVAPEKKDEARILVRNALRQVSFYGAERMVRINQGDRGMDDIRILVPHNVNLFLIPKCETIEQVKGIKNEIDRISIESGIKATVHLMPIIETALGVENAFEIARADESVAALAVGLEDLTADLGVSRTTEGKETFYARSRLVNVCKAAGIQAIDSVFPDVGDTKALEKAVADSKAMGFDGMGCIHPLQVAVVNRGFEPEDEQIEKSRRIILAYHEAIKSGKGVVAMGSKMIDPPVVARAQKIIDLALRLGKIDPGWMEETQDREK